MKQFKNSGGFLVIVTKELFEFIVFEGGFNEVTLVVLVSA